MRSKREGATRRELLQAAVTLPLGLALSTTLPSPLAASNAETPSPTANEKPTDRGGKKRPRVAVVGAGAFGGWTALALRRRGADVVLLDPWGPGHTRSSSGGETRVIRAAYGADALYVDWVARAFAHWEQAEHDFGRKLYHSTGVLWMFSVDDSYAKTSMPLLHERGLPMRELSLTEAKARYPQIGFDGVRSVFLEERAGYLTARLACQAVAEEFTQAGGEYRALSAKPSQIENGNLRGLALGDGSTLEADAYVFACGPWLGKLFPDVISDGVLPTRQEVFYFGPPENDRRFDEGSLPIWIDFAEKIRYGIPGNLHRGWKLADDTRGEPIDPTSAERDVTPAKLAEARELIAKRFPALATAPLTGSEVCQYENSPDGHLILDRHPEAENVWIVGGGSGHGFKLSPTVGEEAAKRVLEGGDAPELFRIARLAALWEKRKTQFGD